MAGCILCARKNSGVPPWHDNDWTFNLGGRALALLAPIIAGLDVQEIRTRDAPGGGPAEIRDQPRRVLRQTGALAPLRRDLGVPPPASRRERRLRLVLGARGHSGSP